METQMILVTRIYVLIQKLNEKKSHQGLLHTVLSQVSKKTHKQNLEKNAKNKNIHNTIWLCVLHKSLMKYTRGNTSN